MMVGFKKKIRLLARCLRKAIGYILNITLKLLGAKQKEVRKNAIEKKIQGAKEDGWWWCEVRYLGSE